MIASRMSFHFFNAEIKTYHPEFWYQQRNRKEAEPQAQTKRKENMK